MTLANERGRWEVEVKKGSAAWWALGCFKRLWGGGGLRR